MKKDLGLSKAEVADDGKSVQAETRRWMVTDRLTIPIFGSVALALSLPEVAEKSALLAATYAVVLFALIVQGLSLRAVIKRVLRR